MTAPIEIIPIGATPTSNRRTLVWSARNPASGIDCNIDPWLTAFGAVSDAALTLARVGVGAFIADRGIKRNELRQRRQIELVVQVPDPDLGKQAAGAITELLSFVTGDDWGLTFEPDLVDRPGPTVSWAADEVALLSGGLDSYCGALIGGGEQRIFLSHSDAPVTKHSQTTTATHIQGYSADRHAQIRLVAKGAFDVEPSRRSRSVLFVALASALAEAAGAATVEVPENGFTSLNPPLAANRAGVLTTRSTHPMSFALASGVLSSLGIAVALRNPYEWLTKGELIRQAKDHVGARVFRLGMGSTLSCAKANMVLRDSGFGRNCGLDYACIVRRAGIRAARLKDNSNYLCEDPNLADEVARLRRPDIEAVKLSLKREPSVLALMAASGPFPPGYDYQRAIELWKRGQRELAAVPLP